VAKTFGQGGRFGRPSGNNYGGIGKFNTSMQFSFNQASRMIQTRSFHANYRL
jgi:hypothetical protein